MTTADHYNQKYRTRNAFSYREWLYQPFISSLMSRGGLRPGATVLDVGCGQGFFSYLLYKSGMRVHGVDLSEAGIQSALAAYGKSGITFQQADATQLVLPHKFDCVFVRSLSLYNTDSFACDARITDSLVQHVRPGGVFMFVYNTRLSSRSKSQSSSWRYHSITDAAEHFRGYPNKEVFFLTKIDTLVLGARAFNRLITAVNSVLSSAFDIGGELVCIVNLKSGPYQSKQPEAQGAGRDPSPRAADVDK